MSQNSIYPEISDAPAHPLIQIPNNMFCGPCFGDITPSESSMATTVEAPTPSPLLLNSEESPSNTNDVSTMTVLTPSLFLAHPAAIDNPMVDAGPVVPRMSTSSPPPPDIELYPSTLELLQPCSNETNDSCDLPLEPHPIVSYEETPEAPCTVQYHISEHTCTLGNQPDRTKSFDIASTVQPQLSLIQVAHKLYPDSFAQPSSNTVNVTPSPPYPKEAHDTFVLPSSSPMNVSPASSPNLPLLSSSQSATDAQIDDNPLNFPPAYMSPRIPSELMLGFDGLDSELSRTDLFPSYGSASSSPPSSSPAQIFTSSPFASSQCSELQESDKVERESNMTQADTITDAGETLSPMHEPTLSPPPPSASPDGIPTSFPPTSLNFSPRASPKITDNKPESDDNKIQLPGALYHPDANEPSASILPPFSEPEIKKINPVAQAELFVGALDESPKVRSPSSQKILEAYSSIDIRIAASPLNKRKHEEEVHETLPSKRIALPGDSAGSSHTEEVVESDIEPLTKRTLLPTTKRPTFASQKLQHKKLATPFRSPVIKKPKVTPTDQSLSTRTNVSHVPHDGKWNVLHKPSLDFDQPPALESPNTTLKAPVIVDTKKKHRTPRAASQFKSPLSASSSAIGSVVRLTPNIQALERQLQILKRAVKVRKDGEEGVLQGLVKKWKEAGREVAWEVWGLVKDRGMGEGVGAGRRGWEDEWGSKGKGNKRGFEDGWGWSEKGDQKKLKFEERERNWGWDVEPNMGEEVGEHAMGEDCEMKESDENVVEEGRKGDTLGTMLKQLGIDPETLGWDEEEGTFIGE